MRFDIRSLRLTVGLASATFATCYLPTTAFAQKADKPAPAADAKADATAPAADAPPQMNAQEQLDKGDAAMKAGDFQAALTAYGDLAAVIERNGANSPEAYQVQLRAWTGRGQALLGLEDYPAALEEFKKVLEGGDLSNVPALIGRGKAYQETNDAEKALTDFQAAVKADRTNSDAQLGLGKALVSLNHADEAVAPLTKAIEADPKNAEAYRLRATANAGQFKNKQAIEDLQKALELKPDDQESYTTLGIVYLRSEDFKNAVANFEKAIDNYKPKKGQEDQPFMQGFLTASSAYVELGKATKDDPAARKAAYEGALELCDKLLTKLDEKNPAYAQARAAVLFSKGVGERMLGHYGAAVRSFSQAIEANPELADAYFRRGICFQMLDEDKMAISDFQQAAHMSDNDPRSNLWEGITFAKMGEYNDAIRAYGDAIAQSDRYTPAYANRALAYMMLADYKKAINDYNEAIRLSPSNAEYYYKRGVAYEMLKDYKKASESFASAIEFDSKLTDAYKHMATVMQALGRTESAAQYRQKGEELPAPPKAKKN